MGKKSAPRPPPAPDPTQIMNEEARLNRVNVSTPYGGQQWSMDDDGKATLTSSFSPEMQALFNQQLGIATSAPDQFNYSPSPVFMELAKHIGGKSGFDTSKIGAKPQTQSAPQAPGRMSMADIAALQSANGGGSGAFGDIGSAMAGAFGGSPHVGSSGIRQMMGDKMPENTPYAGGQPGVGGWRSAIQQGMGMQNKALNLMENQGGEMMGGIPRAGLGNSSVSNLADMLRKMKMGA